MRRHDSWDDGLLLDYTSYVRSYIASYSTRVTHRLCQRVKEKDASRMAHARAVAGGRGVGERDRKYLLGGIVVCGMPESRDSSCGIAVERNTRIHSGTVLSGLSDESCMSGHTHSLAARAKFVRNEGSSGWFVLFPFSPTVVSYFVTHYSTVSTHRRSDVTAHTWVVRLTSCHVTCTR